MTYCNAITQYGNYTCQETVLPYNEQDTRMIYTVIPIVKLCPNSTFTNVGKDKLRTKAKKHLSHMLT